MSDHDTPVSTSAFRAGLADLKDYIREHVDRITARQDIANGRTNKLEAEVAGIKGRMEGYGYEIRDLKKGPSLQRASSDGDEGSLSVHVGKDMAGWIRGGLLLAGAGIGQLVLWLLKATGHA